jgi:hypothetical protein
MKHLFLTQAIIALALFVSACAHTERSEVSTNGPGDSGAGTSVSGTTGAGTATGLDPTDVDDQWTYERQTIMGVNGR